MLPTSETTKSLSLTYIHIYRLTDIDVHACTNKSQYRDKLGCSSGGWLASEAGDTSQWEAGMKISTSSVRAGAGAQPFRWIPGVMPWFGWSEYPGWRTGKTTSLRSNGCLYRRSLRRVLWLIGRVCRLKVNGQNHWALINLLEALSPGWARLWSLTVMGQCEASGTSGRGAGPDSSLKIGRWWSGRLTGPMASLLWSWLIRKCCKAASAVLAAAKWERLVADVDKALMIRISCRSTSFGRAARVWSYLNKSLVILLSWNVLSIMQTNTWGR